MLQDAKGRDFDKEAASWDTPPRVKLAEDIAHSIIARIPLLPTMDLLDFGCGTGLLSLALRPQVRSVAGADLSRGMLNVFRDKITRQGFENVRIFELHDADVVQIVGSYDVIVMSMTLHHIRDIRSFLKAAFLALRSGGYLAVADLEPDGGRFHADPTGVFHNGFDVADLQRMLEETGFVSVHAQVVTEILKPAADGVPARFGIFLMTGQKV